VAGLLPDYGVSSADTAFDLAGCTGCKSRESSAVARYSRGELSNCQKIGTYLKYLNMIPCEDFFLAVFRFYIIKVAQEYR
jgi:hypothetical protein